MDRDIEQDDSQKKRELLYGFFSTCDAPLSEEEERSLNPILNALNHAETRYDTPILIAEGGEKRIYKVYDQHLNRFVAMAQSSTAQTPSEQEQFLREGQLTANLTHPNIVPIHNMGLDSEGVPFFSMELVPGDSLKDIIKKLKADDPAYAAQYTQEVLLGIFNKVCDAVAYAHSRGVLHLDIKPDNIRVGQFGEVLLCDWGLARVLDHNGGLGEVEPGQLDANMLNDMTLTGTVKGTPGFMAPEQVNNQRKTEKTDLYALGSLLYYILTHELPVAGESASEVVENTRKGNIIHPRKYRPRRSVPTGLAAVVMKALALAPADRYESVQALQKEVHRFQAGFPTEAEHADLLTRAGLLAQRHRKLTFWSLVFACLLIVVMSINLTIIRKEKQVAEANFKLYKEEEKETSRISGELASYSLLSQNMPNFIYAERMIPLIDLLLAQNTVDSETLQDILSNQAYAFLITQQFNAALQTYEKLKAPNAGERRLIKVCREYGTLKPDDSAVLADRDLARLLSSNYAIISPSTARLIYYQDCRFSHKKKRTAEEYLEVIRAILVKHNTMGTVYNPVLKLSRRPEGYHLDLAGTLYSAYVLDMPHPGQDFNILQPLNLYSLDISDTPVSLVKELAGLKLKELRMVGVLLAPDSSLPGALSRMGTERIILGKGDYRPWVLDQIRERGIELIEEEYER
ncbi:serine/threonine-protein kinase [Pontiellaceae bacterium B12227]|nr:serine/threonine-protein kinase [Pontiellaceae bacterium B12227]